MLRAALLLQTVQAANYFPGIAPASYSPEQKLPLYVNKLTSTHTQIPYDYYSLPFCHPKIKVYGKGIGSNLEGDRIENSLYKLSVLKNKPCSIVCRKKVTKIGNNFKKKNLNKSNKKNLNKSNNKKQRKSSQMKGMMM